MPAWGCGICEGRLSVFLQVAGTDDHTLIRVIVSRSEVDLFNIRKEFRKNFATSLYSMIKVRGCALSPWRNPQQTICVHGK